MSVMLLPAAPGAEAVTVTVAPPLFNAVTPKVPVNRLMAAARLAAVAVVLAPIEKLLPESEPLLPPVSVLFAQLKLERLSVVAMLFPAVPVVVAVTVTLEPPAAALTPTKEPHPEALITVAKFEAAVPGLKLLASKVAARGLLPEQLTEFDEPAVMTRLLAPLAIVTVPDQVKLENVAAPPAATPVAVNAVEFAPFVTVTVWPAVGCPVNGPV